jgi:ABC-type Fe3+/spermidine/putrescine transport system ATPase subunit
MHLLELHNLHKSYPDGWTLTDVSFSVEEGSIHALLGPSGCGKTTLLRLIAGLETPDGGQLLLKGQDVTHTPPHRRGFGLMFQEYALFPHKDVFGNVAFGLRMQGMEREVIAERVTEALELVGLEGFERRDVSQLSGGERQRVALARSLAPQPRLLMLDEPLGALDRALRERLMDELPHILHRAGVTAITVTHDQEEAFAIADHVVLMHEGHVVQIGAPEEVYRRPASAWAARFLGLTNLLEAEIVEDGVETPLGRLKLQLDQSATRNLQPATCNLLLIRPEAARLGEEGPNHLRVVVETCSFRGEYCQAVVRHASGVELTFNFTVNLDLPTPGEEIDLSLDPRALTLLTERPLLSGK